MFQVKFDNIPETRHCNNFFFKLSLVQKFDIKKQKKNTYKFTTFITTTNEKFFFQHTETIKTRKNYLPYKNFKRKKSI